MINAHSKHFQAMIDPRSGSSHKHHKLFSMVLFCLVLSTSCLHLPTLLTSFSCWHIVFWCILQAVLPCLDLHRWSTIENRSMPVYFREQPSTATKKHLKPAKWRNVKRYQRPTCSQHVTNLCESCDKQINIHNYCISLCPSWTFCDFHSGWMKFNQHAKPIDA